MYACGFAQRQFTSKYVNNVKNSFQHCPLDLGGAREGVSRDVERHASVCRLVTPMNVTTTGIAEEPCSVEFCLRLLVRFGIRRNLCDHFTHAQSASTRSRLKICRQLQ